MDIADITAWAKEFLLADSTHAPTLFMQTDQQIVVAEVRDLPATPHERVLAFGAMGRRVGRERRGETLREVAFIMLAWASLQREGDAAPVGRPSQDPNRKEMMMISMLRLTEGGTEHHGELVEILRDGKGKVHDLVHLPDAQAAQPGNEDPMLLAFIKGYQSSNAPTEPSPQRYNPHTGTGRHGKPPRRK